jgi:predicted phage terminase large subunit-like protein
MQDSQLTSKDLVPQLYFHLCRTVFWDFCLFYDRPFFTKRPFLKQVANSFQEIEEGKIKSLSVSMPPRAGKSYITSLFCAWSIGRNPSESVMRNTCTATLYLKFSYDVRAILKSDKFRSVFAYVSLSDDKSNLNGWNTSQARQVSYFGAGVGGTIIGFGATKIGITDDLYRGLEDALSDTVNDRIIQWKEATHDSRFERGCARIDIGTRWSINDIIGRNIEGRIYDKSIIIPALDESGNSFCEDVMTTKEYEEKRDRTEQSIWSAEYMQEPVDIKGRLFNQMVFLDDVPELEGCIAYVDVADQGADYTAAAVLGVSGNEFYVVDYVYNKNNTDITLPMVSSMLNKWGVKYCRVESNSMGAMFARHLQRETPNCRILQVPNTSKKETRILMQCIWLQQRVKYLNNRTPECLQFLENVQAYSKEGRNKNDDAPDCLAGLSVFAQGMFKHIA